MKVAIVTGGTNGFGYSTCEILLKKGFRVIITSRNLGRATKAAEELKKKKEQQNGSSNGEAIPMILDLNDLSSVVYFANEYQTKYSGNGDVLVYLILNAGVVKLKRDMSPQGIEETYSTNHFGGAALFNMLLEKTLIPCKTRVVAVGSLVHMNSNVILGHDLTGTLNSFSTASYYADTKLFNTLWSFEINKRFAAQGVTSNSVHPGSGLFTNLGRTDASTFLKCMITPLLVCLSPLLWCCGFFQTWYDGGIAEVAAAEATEGGLYFYRHKVSLASVKARDEVLREWLYTQTNENLRQLAIKYNLPMEIAGPSAESL